MKTFELLDIFWKPVKAFIYNVLCRADYSRYLHLKARIVIFAAKLGFYEKEHLSVLRKFVLEGDCAIDVGAHYGIYAEALSDLVGPKGSVVALEPLPEVFSVLSSRLNMFSNIECLNCAASDGSVTSLQLAVPSLAGGVPEPALASHHGNKDATFRVYSVPCRKLDELNFKGRVSFIKIDVEAHEAAVIAGAVETIKKDSPVIQVEVSSSSFGLASSAAPFGLSGYKVASLEEAGIKILSKIQQEGVYYLIPEHLKF